MNSTSNNSDRRTQAPVRVDPVGIFFGPTGPGPFALLALPVGDLEPQAVFAAMHARLDQLARHPQAATPAADEVRLALHSAAAQLADPAVRRLLIGLWASDATILSQSSMPRSVAPSTQRAELEQELHLAIGLNGGWNAAAMQRVALAFQLRGADPADVFEILNQGTRQPQPRTRVAAPVQARRLRSHPKAARVEKEVFRWDLMLLVAFGALAIISLLAVVIMLTPPKVSTPLPTTSSTPETTRLQFDAPDERRESHPAPISQSESIDGLASGDPRVISLEIAGATQDLQTDSIAASGRFARAYQAFGKSWPLMKQDEITSIVSAIVDYVFAASRQDVGVVSSLTSALRQPAWIDRGGVRTIGAEVGITARVLSERDLPRGFLESLRSEAKLANTSWSVEPALSFRIAVERALPEIANALASAQPGSVQAWRDFLDVQSAVLGDKQLIKDQVTLNAIDMLVHAKVASPRDVAPAVQILASSLSWHPGDELRSAVFRWIEDMQVSSELIAELTKAMVASSTPGVDSTMVLPASAGPELRTTLRERLSQVWQAATPLSAEAMTAWEATATQLLAQTPTGNVQQLHLARRLSMLSLSAEMLVQAKPDVAEAVRKEADSLGDSPGPQNRDLVPMPAASPSSPALDFATIGPSVAGRLEALKKIQAMAGETDTLLARMLVIEASRGSPAAVRDAARAELRRRAHAPSVTLATLAFLRLMPETPENADWVSEIAGKPGAWKNRAKWKQLAEVALLTKACQDFPVSTDEALLNSLSDQLAQSWMSRAGEAESTVQSSPLEAIGRLENTLASITRAVGASEPGLTPVEIRRRLAARLSIAPSSLEQVVVQQAACVEWIALAALHDRTKNLDRVRAILSEWNSSRQRAATSIEQLLDGERAALKLQMLRLSAGAKS